MATAICGTSPHCTIGNDKATADAIISTDAVQETRAVDDICSDIDNKRVTTPAYMPVENIAEAASEMKKRVNKVLDITS